MAVMETAFRVSYWHKIAECPDCQYRTSEWNADDSDVCPACGNHRGTWIDGSRTWRFRIARWVPNSGWFKGDAHWEFKDGDADA